MSTVVDSLVDQILEKIAQATELYHRLVLVVAPAGGGKTTALREAQERISATLVNVNLELSRRMLDLTERQRSLQLPKLLSTVIDEAGADTVLLDNFEILFDVALKQDPLRLLQRLSRNRTIVAAWNGTCEGGRLIYASRGHPEFRSYSKSDFDEAMIVSRGS